MKRNLLVLAVMAVAVLFSMPHNAGAQCPQDTIDLGICDTLYVETFDCDHEYEAGPGSFDSVRVAIYVTHDSNTFWWAGENKWVQDSISAFTIPLTFWHQPPGCADSVFLPNWDSWNNTYISPGHPLMNRSMFRHIVDTHTGETTYNRLLQMVENGKEAWYVTIDIDPYSCDGDSGHVFFSVVPLHPNCQKWWEGERELLATLTFHVYMSEDCDTTEIGIDSTFWPPYAWLSFVRYDAESYYPRHFLPVKDTIYIPEIPPTHDVGTSSIQSPPPSIPPGVPVTPSATFGNFGDYYETFPVTCRIDSAGMPIYTHEDTVTNLTPGDSIQISFPLWTPCECPGNAYLVTFYTSLAGDANPANDARSTQTETHIQVSFTPAYDTTITSGEYWFYDFIIGPNVTVEFLDSVTLNVENQFLLDTLGTLWGDCAPLIINHLSTSEPLQIFGDLIDTSLTPPDSGGQVVIRSLGSMTIGGDTTFPQANIVTSGPLFIGDPFYAPRPTPDTIGYFFTGEDSMDIPPACNVKASFVEDRDFSFEFIDQDPFANLIIQRTIYFGNGDSLVNPPSPLVYTYDSVGVYEVKYEAMDVDNNVSTATLVLVVPEGKIYQGYVSPFADTNLVKPMGVPFSFIAEKGPCDSVKWYFGDGTTSESLSVTHAYESPGEYGVYLSIWHENFFYVAKMNVLVTLQGAKIAVEDPPAPDIPFPCLPEGLVRSEFVTNNEASACTMCDLQEPPPGWQVVWFGNVWIKTSLEVVELIEGWAYLTVGWKWATYVIRPGFTFTGLPGADGRECRNGIPGWGFRAATIYGEIILCGGIFSAGPGGRGGDCLGQTGCPAIAEGGKGGHVSGVTLIAGYGKITYCGPVTLYGADGGDGGDAGANGDVPPAPCDDGCDADAWGGKGGMGGTTIDNLVVSRNRVLFDTTRNCSVTFVGGVKGGDGGTGSSAASHGRDCPFCADEAGDGGEAYAEGGNGGNCWWKFSIGGAGPYDPSVIWARNKRFIFQELWIGGAGKDAIAVAGFGGHGDINCCPPLGPWLPGTDGGDGGDATAFGGKGGGGINFAGVGGQGTAICGDGGWGSNGVPPGMGGRRGWGWNDITPLCNPGVDGPPCPWLAAPPPPPPLQPVFTLPPNFCPFPPCNDTLDLFQADSLVGQIAVRFIGLEQFQAISGDSIPPVYWNNEGYIHVIPGGIVIYLTDLPEGDTAYGFDANVTDLCGTPQCVVLEGYRNDVKVVDTMNTQGCEEVLLDIWYAEGLDSVILWGWDFKFWGKDILITVSPFIRGDANGSGSVDLADAVYIINWLFIGGPPPDPLWLGDANSSGGVDLADAVYIVNWLFIGGPPPGCE